MGLDAVLGSGCHSCCCFDLRRREGLVEEDREKREKLGTLLYDWECSGEVPFLDLY